MPGRPCREGSAEVPRKARRRHKQRAALSMDQRTELLCGPTPRGTGFDSPAERARARRTYRLPATREMLAREAAIDALRARRSATPAED